MAKITIEMKQQRFVVFTDDNNVQVSQHREVNRQRSYSQELRGEGDIVTMTPPTFTISIPGPYTIEDQEEIVKSDEVEKVKKAISKMQFMVKNG